MFYSFKMVHFGGDDDGTLCTVEPQSQQCNTTLIGKWHGGGYIGWAHCAEMSHTHTSHVLWVFCDHYENVVRVAPSTIDTKQILLLLVHQRQTSTAYTDHILLNFSYLHIMRNKPIYLAASCYTLYISITQSSPLLKRAQLLSLKYMHRSPRY